MKRIMLTITMIMAFGLTVCAGHNTKATPAENISAQSPTMPGHQGVSLDGHPD